MAMYVSVSDLEDRLGVTFDDDDLVKIVSLIDDAEAVLDLAAGSLAARIEHGRTSAHLVKIVVCNMVSRLLRNPDGLRGETYPEYAYVVDPAASSSWLTITRDDKKLLGIRRGAVSVPMGDDALRRPLRFPYYDHRYDLPVWVA